MISYEEYKAGIENRDEYANLFRFGDGASKAWDKASGYATRIAFDDLTPEEMHDWQVTRKRLETSRIAFLKRLAQGRGLSVKKKRKKRRGTPNHGIDWTDVDLDVEARPGDVDYCEYGPAGHEHF